MRSMRLWRAGFFVHARVVLALAALFSLPSCYPGLPPESQQPPRGQGPRGRGQGALAGPPPEGLAPVVDSIPELYGVGLDTVKAGRFDQGKMWTFEFPPLDYLRETYNF